MRQTLTLKQQKFVVETMKDLNPTRAAMVAYNLGGKGGEDNYGTARAIASENLTKPLIKQAFKKLLEQLDDGKYLNRLDEIAMSADSRASLQAIDQIMTLKDRKPAGKLKMNEYAQEVEELKD